MIMPGLARQAPPAACEVVVIGGGIAGLSVAYELARRGVRGVVVLEAAHPGVGASGRNGELIRSAFASREWGTLFDLSLRKWHGLAAELEANTLFTRAG